MTARRAHLESAFVTKSLCSPSRASILIGRYAHSHSGGMGIPLRRPPGQQAGERKLPTEPGLIGPHPRSPRRRWRPALLRAAAAAASPGACVNGLIPAFEDLAVKRLGPNVWRAAR